jgi:hypothetical protein
MTKQKLAKLEDIQQAILAHNSEWKVLVDIKDIGLCRVDYLFLCGNGLIQMQYRSSKDNHFTTKQVDFKDLYIGEENHPDFYLHSEHNEELEPKIDDFVYGSFLEHNSTYEEDLKILLNTTSHAISFNQQSDPVSLVHFKQLEAETQIYYLKTCYRIIYRENVAYFPQFEWVTYHD